MKGSWGKIPPTHAIKKPDGITGDTGRWAWITSQVVGERKTLERGISHEVGQQI